tara:strand:+ start:30 stop:506 length:477 start_codon:yes stop_codon:yes gene_type:complete
MAFQVIKIKNTTMLNKIISDIKKAKKSKEITNVKAKITDWNSLLKKNSIKYFLNKYLANYFIYEIWGNIYKQKDYVVEHDHVNTSAHMYFDTCGVLFLTNTKTPLNFTSMLKKHFGKKGDLLLFKPNELHSVDKVIDKERITLSFNGRMKEEYEKEKN